MIITEKLSWQLQQISQPNYLQTSIGHRYSRLDRVLVSEEWLDKWPMSKQYVQNREVSDHCAIVVKSLVKDWGPKPFRSIDAWLLEKGFCDMIKDKWGSYAVQGEVFQKIKMKLKCLKEDLKIWNREVFGNLHTKKKGLLEEIEDLDCKDCNVDLGESDRLRRYDLVGRLMETEKKIDSLICQKARVSWFKNGDSCTKFFNSSLRWRRLRNEVKGVKVGGLWCEEPGTVRTEAKRLFENRFKATRDFGVRLDGVEFKTISIEDNVSLVAGFDEEEIREALWLCEGTKSPGPDGFNMNFIKKSWGFIKDEVVEAFTLFHKNGVIPRDCNASFVEIGRAHV